MDPKRKMERINSRKLNVLNVPDDAFFSPDALAIALGCAKKTVMSWTSPRNDGKHLRRWKSGNVVVIRGSWIKEFFDGQAEA